MTEKLLEILKVWAIGSDSPHLLDLLTEKITIEEYVKKVEIHITEENFQRYEKHGKELEENIADCLKNNEDPKFWEEQKEKNKTRIERDKVRLAQLEQFKS